MKSCRESLHNEKCIENKNDRKVFKRIKKTKKYNECKKSLSDIHYILKLNQSQTFACENKKFVINKIDDHDIDVSKIFETCDYDSNEFQIIIFFGNDWVYEFKSDLSENITIKNIKQIIKELCILWYKLNRKHVKNDSNLAMMVPYKIDSILFMTNHPFCNLNDNHIITMNDLNNTIHNNLKRPEPIILKKGADFMDEGIGIQDRFLSVFYKK